jgi:hypothetical protein
MGREERYVFQCHPSAWAVVGIIGGKQKWFRARGHGQVSFMAFGSDDALQFINSRRRQEYARNEL